jgi:hypothetical protein
MILRSCNDDVPNCAGYMALNISVTIKWKLFGNNGGDILSCAIKFYRTEERKKINIIFE